MKNASILPCAQAVINKILRTYAQEHRSEPIVMPPVDHAAIAKLKYSELTGQTASHP